MVRSLFIFSLVITLVSACTPAPERQLNVPNIPAAPEKQLNTLKLPEATTQVILVTSSDWSTSDASLQCFARENRKWQSVAAPVKVKIGRNGMGWGLGLHVEMPGIQKKEGDGKSPAGIFSLGNAFGYASTAPAGMKLHYRPATERDYFVDAVDSPDYNHWTSIPKDRLNDPEQYWSSFERMHRDDNEYEYGLVIEHNMRNTIPGRGSAIFMHVWANEAKPTSGCTAMDKANLLKVLCWLNPQDHPLLVQVPVFELEKLKLATAMVKKR